MISQPKVLIDFISYWQGDDKIGRIVCSLEKLRLTALFQHFRVKNLVFHQLGCQECGLVCFTVFALCESSAHSGMTNDCLSSVFFLVDPSTGCPKNSGACLTGWICDSWLEPKRSTVVTLSMFSFVFSFSISIVPPLKAVRRQPPDPSKVDFGHKMIGATSFQGYMHGCPLTSHLVGWPVI